MELLDPFCTKCNVHFSFDSCIFGLIVILHQRSPFGCQIEHYKSFPFMYYKGFGLKCDLRPFKFIIFTIKLQSIRSINQPTRLYLMALFNAG